MAVSKGVPTFLVTDAGMTQVCGKKTYLTDLVVLSKFILVLNY